MQELNSLYSNLKTHLILDGFDLILDLDKSDGCFLVDKGSKRQYFDFFTFFASLPLGMNHKRLVEPKFLAKLGRVGVNKPSNSDVATEERLWAVKTFVDHAVPDELPHLFFISGGALAVENALKAAFDWKAKKNFQKGIKSEKGHQVIHFKQAFHGRSGYTLSLTNTTDPRKTQYFPKFNWPRVDNDESKAIDQIKQALHDNPDDIAALIIEPIQGEGGDHHFTGQFFQKLRDLADENEFLLIFDEVQTGLGLTGKWWCFQHFDVMPDIVTFGKKTQVCGMMAGRRIDEIENNVFVESSRINSTFGGNLVDFVRLQRIIEVIVEDNLIANAVTAGEYLLGKLGELSAEFPDKISRVRGQGLMCAFDLSSTEMRNSVVQNAFTHELIVLGCGPKSIRFRPMLPMSPAEIDEGLSRLAKAIKLS